MNELYELQTDPREQVDLASRDPDRAAALRRRVEPMLDDLVAGLGLAGGMLERLPEDAARELRALGYLLEESSAASPAAGEAEGEVEEAR